MATHELTAVYLSLLLYFVVQTRKHGLIMANVRLSEDTRNRLEVLSKARDRTPHYLMKTAIERFLDVEEALEAEHRLVLGRWEKFELTGETVDHEEVKAWAASLRKSESESA